MNNKKAVVVFLGLVWSCIFLVMGFQLMSLLGG